MTYLEALRRIKRGDVISLRHAIESGLDPNLTGQFGGSLLLCAAIEGNTSIGRLLIEAGAEVNYRGALGGTALTWAIMGGHVGFVKLLLDAGASLDCYAPCHSLAIFIDWVEQYCAVSKEQVDKIRLIFNAISEN